MTWILILVIVGIFIVARRIVRGSGDDTWASDLIPIIFYTLATIVSLVATIVFLLVR